MEQTSSTKESIDINEAILIVQNKIAELTCEKSMTAICFNGDIIKRCLTSHGRFAGRTSITKAEALRIGELIASIYHPPLDFLGKTNHLVGGHAPVAFIQEKNIYQHNTILGVMKKVRPTVSPSLIIDFLYSSSSENDRSNIESFKNYLDSCSNNVENLATSFMEHIVPTATPLEPGRIIKTVPGVYIIHDEKVIKGDPYALRNAFTRIVNDATQKIKESLVDDAKNKVDNACVLMMSNCRSVKPHSITCTVGFNGMAKAKAPLWQKTSVNKWSQKCSEENAFRRAVMSGLLAQPDTQLDSRFIETRLIITKTENNGDSWNFCDPVLSYQVISTLFNASYYDVKANKFLPVL